MKKRKNKKTKQKNKAKKPNEPLMMSSFRILKCKTWFQQYNFPQIKKISVSKQNIIHITVLYYFITVCNIKVEWPKVFFFFFHGNPNSWWHPWDTHTHAHTLRVKREREKHSNSDRLNVVNSGSTEMIDVEDKDCCQSFPYDTQVRGSAATVRSQRQLYHAVI